MKRKQTQTEKLFTNECLSMLVKKIESIEIGLKIEKGMNLKKIFNNRNFE
jgi:hypothetical protein